MPQCSCGSETINVNGQVWSKHFEPAHWSRKNRGHKKPPPQVKLSSDREDVAAGLRINGWSKADAHEAAMNAKGDSFASLFASATAQRAKDLTE